MQKLKEQEELRREERLKERKFGRTKSDSNLDDKENLKIPSSTLEKFEIDKSSQN